MEKVKSIASTKEVDESFKNCNVELFIATLIKIIERKENVKITYELRKKSPEELEQSKIAK